MAKTPEVTEGTRMLEEQMRQAAAAEILTGKTTIEKVGSSEAIGADEGGGFEVHTTDREKVTMYNTMNGQPSEFLIYMVGKRLSHKRPDGKPVWTLNPAEAPPYKVGTLKCPLHHDHEDRAWIDSIGLDGVYCGVNNPEGRDKENIPSQFQVVQHMRRKHPTAFATIEQAREKEEKEEERKWQRQMMEAMAGKKS